MMKFFLSLCLSPFLFTSCAAQSGGKLQKNADGSTTLIQNSTEKNSIYLSADGKLGIGKKDPQDKLEVNGQIHARSVKVDLHKWADIVFKDDYELLRLREIEAFIKKNGHLPEIPSEKTVLKQGIELGEMNRLLIKKIEEITLHLIEKEKQIDKLTKSVSILQRQVQHLKTTD